MVGEARINGAVIEFVLSPLMFVMVIVALPVDVLRVRLAAEAESR